jgi:TolA-binding protein
LRIVQALVALGRHDEAERAASQFISQYPNNSHVNELRKLTASTNRDSPRESY